MNPIQITSLIALLFGILILITPAIINYLVAIFFIVIGINGLLYGAKINRLLK